MSWRASRFAMAVRDFSPVARTGATSAAMERRARSAAAAAAFRMRGPIGRPSSCARWISSSDTSSMGCSVTTGDGALPAARFAASARSDSFRLAWLVSMRPRSESNSARVTYCGGVSLAGCSAPSGAPSVRVSVVDSGGSFVFGMCRPLPLLRLEGRVDLGDRVLLTHGAGRSLEVPRLHLALHVLGGAEEELAQESSKALTRLGVLPEGFLPRHGAACIKTPQHAQGAALACVLKRDRYY